MQPESKEEGFIDPNSKKQLVIMSNRIGACLILATVCCLVLASIVYAAETITLGSGTWAQLTGQNLPHQGTLTRLIRDAYDRVGIHVQRKQMPWARVLQSIEDGSIDGGYPLGRTKDREAKYVFSHPIGSANRYIYHRKDSPFQWNSIEDLRGLRIGIVRGAVFGAVHEVLMQRMAEAHNFAHINYVTTDIQNLKMLHAQRIDVFFGEENQTAMLAHQFSETNPGFQADSIVAAPKALMDNSSLHLIFRNDATGVRLRDMFDRGLMMLQGDNQAGPSP